MQQNKAAGPVEPAQLYLDLMKRILTNVIYEDPRYRARGPRARPTTGWPGPPGSTGQAGRTRWWGCGGWTTSTSASNGWSPTAFQVT